MSNKCIAFVLDITRQKSVRGYLTVEQKKRVAVIGSGIGGLSAAWLLRQDADVTLFEADGRFGGHTHTVSVAEGDREVPIDTGFMVFNRPNYPLLSALFDHLLDVDLGHVLRIFVGPRRKQAVDQARRHVHRPRKRPHEQKQRTRVT